MAAAAVPEDMEMPDADVAMHATGPETDPKCGLASPTFQIWQHSVSEVGREKLDDKIA